jgi:hypothetical protein
VAIGAALQANLRCKVLDGAERAASIATRSVEEAIRCRSDLLAGFGSVKVLSDRLLVERALTRVVPPNAL